MGHSEKYSPQPKRRVKILTPEELVQKLEELDTTDPHKLVKEVRAKFGTKPKRQSKPRPK